MIQAVLRVVAPPHLRDELLEVVRGLTGPTEVTKGCRICRAFRDIDNDLAFTYWVQWDDLDDLEQHFRSERFRRLLPYIEMSPQPPQLEVSSLDHLGGVELMVAAIGTNLTK